MNQFAPKQHQVDPFAASLAGRRLGRYEVLARLATGGMAAVYIARALGLAGFERLFAIKVLHPHLAHEEEFVSMFLDEARLAARIHHPNVVATIDISDVQDAGYYLVMDYIEGHHLGALMREASKTNMHRLPTDAALRVIVDALGGLGAAHDLTDDNGRPINLIHRDISPQNIMVGVDGIARLTDFGVAKAETRLSSTREGQFKGKLAYMSPEHASEGYTDQRSDLFAMATILWECLTGKRLFRAENHAATLNKVCLEPIPLPSSVLTELAPFDDILEKGLARNPDERFQSAADFVEAIEERANDIGGIGAKRTVSAVVKELAVEKLDYDRELIRKGMEAVKIRAVSAGSSSAEQPPPAAPVQPAPVEPRPYPRPPPIARPAAASPIPQPYAEAVSQQEQPGRAERGKAIWIAGGVVLILVLGTSVAALLLARGETEGITTSPLRPTEVPAPAPVVPASPVPAPGAEEPEETAKAVGMPGEGKPTAEKDDKVEAAEKKKSGAKAQIKRTKGRATRRTGRKRTTVSEPSGVSGEIPEHREKERSEPTPTDGEAAPKDIFDNPYR